MFSRALKDGFGSFNQSVGHLSIVLLLLTHILGEVLNLLGLFSKLVPEAHQWYGFEAKSLACRCRGHVGSTQGSKGLVVSEAATLKFNVVILPGCFWIFIILQSNFETPQYELHGY